MSEPAPRATSCRIGTSAFIRVSNRFFLPTTIRDGGRSCFDFSHCLSTSDAGLALYPCRRLGEFIRAQKETVGLAKGWQPYQAKSTGSLVEPVATLAAAGIDKKLSRRAQRFADASTPVLPWLVSLKGNAPKNVTPICLMRSGTYNNVAL